MNQNQMMNSDAIVGIAQSVDPDNGTVEVQLNGMHSFPVGPVWIAPQHTTLPQPGQIITTPNTGGYPMTDIRIGDPPPDAHWDQQFGETSLLSTLQSLGSTMNSTDQHVANLLSEFLKQVDPQDEGALQLKLDPTARIHNEELVVNAVNAEISFEESVVRVEKIKLTHKFMEADGVWTPHPILKIALRTVTIMDLGDDE